MKKVLYLEKRGCNFWSGTKEFTLSDVGNYRVVTTKEVKGKDGNNYILEFCLCHDIGHYRTLNKRTGKPLKYPVYEVDEPCGLQLRTYYETKNGCFGNLQLENEILAEKRLFSKANILEVVNKISTETFTEIEFTEVR